MHPCRKKGQQHPEPERAERCRQGEAGEPSSLLSAGEASSAGPGSPVQETHGLTEASP